MGQEPEPATGRAAQVTKRKSTQMAIDWPARGALATKPEETPIRPVFAVNDDGKMVLQVTREGNFGEMLGNTSTEYATELTCNCLQTAGGKETGIIATNRALGIAIELQPRDAVEAMWVTQMAATHTAVTHTAVMRCSMMMANNDTLQQLEFLERAVNKLGRTFTSRMEALRKHRNGGKQTATVRHVNVLDGVRGRGAAVTNCVP